MARLSFEEIKQWAVDATDGYQNKRGGVNFPCPVDDHPEPAPGQREQQASAWRQDDGTTGVKCWGGCDWRDLLANIEAAIAVSQPEDGAAPKAAPPPTQATNGAVRRPERENGHVEPTSDWAELRPRLVQRWVEPQWTGIGKGLEAAYIPVSDVLERLDALVGAENWQTACEVVGETSVKVSLTILGVTREDIGTGTHTVNAQGEVVQFNALKKATSDGLKRAASAFGIGRWVRTIPNRRAK